MPALLTFRLVSNPTDPSIADIIRIYCESIPAPERKPATWITQAVQRDDFVILSVMSGADAVAFATVFVPPDAGDWALVEYLAVDSRLRGRGIGAATFNHLMQMLPSRALLLEVDSDREESPLRAERSRRIQFYQRLGCRRIRNLPYLLPLNTTPPPPPMDLLIANPPAARLKASTLRKWIQIIYERVYEQSPQDPRIETMFARIVDPVTLHPG